jgi:hypothetical protein
MSGLPTVSITLNPEETGPQRPPRQIHPVNFKIGNAFGHANQPDLQREVLRAALEYLNVLVMPGTITDIEFPEYKPEE